MSFLSALSCSKGRWCLTNYYSVVKYWQNQQYYLLNGHFVIQEEWYQKDFCISEMAGPTCRFDSNFVMQKVSWHKRLYDKTENYGTLHNFYTLPMQWTTCNAADGKTDDEWMDGHRDEQTDTKSQTFPFSPYFCFSLKKFLMSVMWRPYAPYTGTRRNDNECEIWCNIFNASMPSQWTLKIFLHFNVTLENNSIIESPAQNRNKV